MAQPKRPRRSAKGKTRKPPPGRPPILLEARKAPDGKDTTVEGLVLQALRTGATYEMAATYAGVGESTLMSWLQRARNAIAISAEHGRAVTAADRPYLDFLEAVEKARSDARVGALGAVFTAARKGHWQAAAWFLERQMPREFGRKQLIDIGAFGGEDAGDRVTIAELVARLGRERSG